jgi:uncharacterized protein YukE
MAEDFYLDPDKLAQATGALRYANEELSSQLAKLTGVLQQHDGCWGTDDIGKAFAKKYVQPSHDAQAGITATTGGVDATVRNLDSASTQFQGLDEESAQRLDASIGQQGSS